MTTTALTHLFNAALPWVALSLWCAIYGIYFGRDPAIRRWLERALYDRTHRHHPVALVRPLRPMPSHRPPSGPAVALITAPNGAASARVPAWEVSNLPLRYRLLGQVRPAANDN